MARGRSGLNGVRDKLAALERVAEDVVIANKLYGQTLKNGTDQELHVAQLKLWDELSKLERVLDNG